MARISMPDQPKRLKPVCPKCCRVLIERGMAKAGKLCQSCKFMANKMNRDRGAGNIQQ